MAVRCFTIRLCGWSAFSRPLLLALGCLCITAAAVCAPPQDQLPPPVVAVMIKQRLPPAGLSVFIQDVASPQPLLAVNAEIPRNPASSLKVLTTFAALELLGPAYTWKTAAYLGGPLEQGRLRGDLILKGSGDPFLTTEYFWKFLRGLRDRGLQHIDGDLVIDNSYFEAITADPGAFDGRPLRAYNAVPSALMLNFQTIGFSFYPQPQAQKIAIVADPNPANLTIDNKLQLTQARCRQRRLQIDVLPSSAGATVAFTGSYPASCGEWSLTRSVLSPEQLVFGVFLTLWRELGGQFSGTLAVRSGPAPGGQKPFHVLESRPLAELIRAINKYSNNVMTRQLLLTLGAEQFGAPGNETKGQAAIQGWLQKQGLVFPELVIDNGAGLSRSARISAHSLGQLLLAAYRSPYAPELQASLPLAAVDGTLSERFRGEALAARLRLKTGSIDDVKAIAGYVAAPSGRTYAVVALHNHPGIHQGAGTLVQDALLRWLFEQ
jgi:D-alanyl-D-alanine carboxypeptidase/D-alanyl-D-alanine-endopeptidase (penicillin-binding protein 4)